MGRAIMVVSGNTKFVGIPKREKLVNDGIDEHDNVIVAIENCVEMVTVPMPMQDAAGRQGLGTAIIGIPCGDIVEYGEGLVIELENNSLYYEKYVEVTSGVTIEAPSITRIKH